jgi:hypothetical protein
MNLREALKRLAVPGADRFEQVLGAFALLFEVGRGGKIDDVRRRAILLSSPGVRIAGRKKDRETQS